MATQKQKQTLSEAQVVKYGHDAAEAFINAEKVAEQSKRDILLQVARETVNYPESHAGILDAYNQTFLDNGVAKTVAKARKSEFKTVLEAVGKASKNADILSKVSGYHAFILKARDLRDAGQAKSRSGGNTSTRTPKFTDKQAGQLTDKLKAASVKQAVDIAETALETMLSPKQTATKEGATVAGYQTLLFIQSSAMQLLKNEHVEQVFKTAAEAVIKAVEPAIESARKAMAQAKATTEKAKQEPAKQQKAKVAQTA